MKKILKSIVPMLALCILFSACTPSGNILTEQATSISQVTTQQGSSQTQQSSTTTKSATVASVTSSSSTIDLDSIPEFTSQPYVVINNNVPDFDKSDYTTSSFESYGDLDELGRCTTCYACVSTDTMPTTKRGEIGSVKPTGWHTVKYDNVDGKYLYNRCHLIGYQLTAENANEKNLITGTRYLNVDGMLPFENEVADYVEETNNHVLYRVTPIFVDDELVARGVQMEAYSVEDNGSGVCFNVYCYNNQPDIVIDYATGESHAVNSSDNYDDGSTTSTYIVNLNTKKFHTSSCQYAKSIKEDNKKTYVGSRDSLINNGYQPCQSCNP